MQAYPDAPFDMVETLAKDYFIDALGDADTRWRVYQSRPRMLADAVTVAVELDAFRTAEFKRGSLRRPVARVINAKYEEEKESKSVRTGWVADETSGIFVKGYMQGTPVTFLVDTGANITIINPKIYAAIPKSSRPLLRPVSVDMVLANGNVLLSEGQGEFQIETEGNNMMHNVRVAEIGVDAILGLDFLRDHNYQLDVLKGCLYVKEPCEASIRAAVSDISCYHVSVDETVVIAPGTEAMVVGRISEGPQCWESGLLEPAENFAERHCMLVANSLVDPREGKIPVRVFNPMSNAIRLYQGTVVGTVGEANLLEDPQEDEPDVDFRVAALQAGSDGTKTVPDHVQSLLEQDNPDLNSEQRRSLAEMLRTNADVFARSSTDLGRTTVVKHKINTGNAQPIKQAARRVPVQQREKERELVKEMLDAGVVEPSSSPWASPVVLVKKKNGSTRFCVDYRKLNAVTMKDSYPIPRIAESLDAMSGAQWFSTLDLASGYWQVGMEEKDRQKTAFITGSGLYQFRLCRLGSVTRRPPSKD
ncbi:hypothetical protein HOLleu_33014 [Holothuria leucospilota]|uniref:Peptidase A2 domain-containing protein n=1 Tax=Holothuria leucospilota TaxID=206669 RepID=A0A9Q0YMY0_HOLLE|nr:hypothetical protein HOLleu_33014 [Holothuria leucospilota]